MGGAEKRETERTFPRLISISSSHGFWETFLPSLFYTEKSLKISISKCQRGESKCKRERERSLLVTHRFAASAGAQAGEAARHGLSPALPSAGPTSSPAGRCEQLNDFLKKL